MGKDSGADSCASVFQPTAEQAGTGSPGHVASIDRNKTPSFGFSAVLGHAVPRDGISSARLARGWCIQVEPSGGISFRSTGERHIPGRASPELVWFQTYVPSLHASGN